MGVICADVLEWAREYEGPKFHALLCDPPWHLKGGFMGRYWDQDGPDAISFQPETWAALAEHLHPGAFLFVFAGSRGWHRLACAMEDAGLILQPSIFVWLQAQAFPKATRIDTAIDKAAGIEQVVIPNPLAKQQTESGKYTYGARAANEMLTLPVTDLARAWEGHRYGGQVLKDCATPIIVAQKPWTDPRLDCIVETGAGALWVDGGRIGVETITTHSRGSNQAFPKRPGERTVEESGRKSRQDLIDTAPRQGRWPPNFCLVHKPPTALCPDCEGDGCEACGGDGVVGGYRRVGVRRVRGDGHFPKKVPGGDRVAFLNSKGIEQDEKWLADETVDAWECEPDCPARKLGEQSGKSETKRIEKPSDCGGNTWGGTIQINRGPRGHTDKGTCARFYHQAGWEYECMESCPVAKLDEQAGERKSGGKDGAGNISIWGSEDNRSGGHMKPSTGSASRFYAQADWSREIAERLAMGDPVRYVPKAAKRERNEGLDDFYWRKDKESPIGFVRVTREEWEALGEEEKRIKAEMGKRVSLRARGNIHPTVKPISLCEWLAKLLLPPKEYGPRRILVPFAGSGSEGIGAGLAGWEEVEMVELLAGHCEMAEARWEFWMNGRQLELWR